jgi:hypothetical protein
VDEETYLGALQTLTYRWPSGYWTSDTLVPCGSPTHIALVASLGIPGVLFFALGLPVGLWVYLAHINKQKVDGRNRLEDPEVRGWVERGEEGVQRFSVARTHNANLCSHHCWSYRTMLFWPLPSAPHTSLFLHWAPLQ